MVCQMLISMKLFNFIGQMGYATVTAVRPPGRYGSLCLEKNQVCSFKEKPEGENSWINGGFCIKKEVIDYIEDDNTSWK